MPSSSPSGAEGRDTTEALARVAAALACDDESGWRRELDAARRAATDTQVEEVLLQSHLFVGFPVVLNALIVWRQLAGEHEHAERADPPVDLDLDERARAGRRLCERVYGGAYGRLRENVRALSPTLDRWMIEDGYGKTLSRPALDAVTRELCIVAQLTAGGHPRQLRSHLFGALNVGASPEEVGRAVEIGSAALDRGRRADGVDPDVARDMWRDIRRGLDT
ncbi:MAG: carboxymuconolactone decarboxylase family protein [Gemmatimonadetes bacterium]|nr:carboxymuconolactone decarboxylase family protein [Gemmatimonadota bacterium]